MEVFVTKWFDRWCRKEAISDAALCKAVSDMKQGLIDANLGGNLYKMRVAAPGRGKRGSYRTLLAFRSGERACFVYGFPKKARANIDGREEKALKALAKEVLAYRAPAIRKAVAAKELREVRCDHEQEK